jgi:hypothetical protein
VQRREVFENMTVKNTFYDKKTKCFKLKIDFREKSVRESKVVLMFPESMTEYIQYWIEICMKIIILFFIIIIIIIVIL